MTTRDRVDAMRRVTVQVSRDGRFWLVFVPEIGQYTQARTLRQVEEMVIDLVAVWEDRDPAAVTVGDVSVELPEEARADLDRAAELTRSANKARAEAAMASRRAVATLRERGWSLRDIGDALGVSYQRVGQLAADRW